MLNSHHINMLRSLPFNIASYAILLEMFAKFANMVPGDLICSLGDTHIYLNQIEAIQEQLKRKPFALPKLEINWPKEFKTDEYNFPELTYKDFKVVGYESHDSIKIPISV